MWSPEAMPSPPPPYSPDSPDTSQQAARPSPMLEGTGFTASPLPTHSSARNSPAMPMSPAFSPPPQLSRHRERSASGLAGPRAFLSGLRGKQPAAAEAQLRPSNTVHLLHFEEASPPAARRAASTGHLESNTSISGPSARSSPDNSWQPGMPLPPPPPGGPPPGTRSQSLNRYPPSSSRSNSHDSESGFRSQHQRLAAATSKLGPILSLIHI